MSIQLVCYSIHDFGCRLFWFSIICAISYEKTCSSIRFLKLPNHSYCFHKCAQILFVWDFVIFKEKHNIFHFAWYSEIAEFPKWIINNGSLCLVKFCLKQVRSFSWLFCSLVGGRWSGGADGCWGKFSFSTTGACSVVDGVDAGAAEICENGVSFDAYYNITLCWNTKKCFSIF